MARPKKEKGEVAQNVGLRMNPQDWKALEEKAKDLGFQGRAELIRAIARGQAQADRRTVILGELVPG
ncbi:MAG: hypothetical protein DCF22_00720 [Leptolyngbya sp.]|nr:MAG: hypothetical protein DCF22_00720 [Leptolyngbya sp.]